MKFCVASLAIVAIATPAIGHDVWMQPQRYQVQANAPLPILFLIGHGPFRDNWQNNQGVILFVDNSKTGTRNIIRDLTDGPPDAVTTFAQPGLHVLAMQSKYAFSELPSIRFNDYAKAEGLTPVLAARQQEGTMNASGRERYSRRAKAIIQVGAVPAKDQALATKPVGLKLEIVPDVSPYALPPSRLMPVHVLYDNHLLPNATVMLTDLAHDATPLQTVVTDRSGKAVFKIPATGNLLLNVLWSERVKGDPAFDFDTTFSSLTFGY
jgi:hypothetical protein